jgi:hypothetical protein
MVSEPLYPEGVLQYSSSILFPIFFYHILLRTGCGYTAFFYRFLYEHSEARCAVPVPIALSSGGLSLPLCLIAIRSRVRLSPTPLLDGQSRTSPRFI